MKTVKLLALLAAVCLLVGCAPLLERTYSTAEPHSGKFWESEAAGTLRAENRQDIVNDLLLLISRRTENATLRLYNFKDDMTVAETVERATTEIQQETPMGAYAVEYITTVNQSQRSYYEIAVQISYRRTAEQIQAVVNATSPAALYSLLETALNDGKTELAVRLGYWDQEGPAQVEEAVAQLWADRALEDTTPWVVNYYPANGPVGLVEFLMDPSEEDIARAELVAGESVEDALAEEETLPEEETPPESAEFAEIENN